MPMGPWDLRDAGDKSVWHSWSLLHGPRQSLFCSTVAIFQKGNRHLGCVCVCAQCMCAYIHVHVWKSEVNLCAFPPSTAWIPGIELVSTLTC